MDINITVNSEVRSKLGKLSKKAIVQLAEKILRNMKCSSDVELSILITDDTEIRKLNKKYRHKNKATDVLSFAPAEAKEFVCLKHILGDVVISVETAKRQAQELGVAFADEFARLLIHGILHLLGYDHENVSPRRAKEMQGTEDRLLSQISRCE